MSVTVTSWVQVAVSPELSVTVQVTVVAPIGNVAGALLVTEATPQLSAVTGVPSKTPLAVQSPASVFTFTAAGHEIVGFSLSVTITLNTQSVVPQLFAAVTVTVVVPTLKDEPEPDPFPLPAVAPENE